MLRGAPQRPRRPRLQLLRIDGDRPGVRDAVKKDETQDTAADLFVRQHDACELIEGASLVARGQSDAGEEVVVAGNILGAELPTGMSESRGEAAADGHGVTVSPRVVVRALDRVSKGVSVVQDLAQATFRQVR